MSNHKMENGEVYISFMKFAEEREKANGEGKIRPVVVFQTEDKTYLCKISSQVDKPLKQKLGYELQDWKEAGLKKPSIVALDRENMIEIDASKIKKYVGKVSDRDIKGMFIKHIQVLAKERQLEIHKQNTLER